MIHSVLYGTAITTTATTAAVAAIRIYLRYVHASQRIRMQAYTVGVFTITTD